MATGTVYLDVDDEITSAAARIRGSEATKVALVVPYGSRIATSRMNFRLLAREAVVNNRRLSIVATDAATRALAASAGLPVFASVAEWEAAIAPPGAASSEAMESSVPPTEVARSEATPAREAASTPPPARPRSRKKAAQPDPDETQTLGLATAGTAAAAGATAASGSVAAVPPASSVPAVSPAPPPSFSPGTPPSSPPRTGPTAGRLSVKRSRSLPPINAPVALIAAVVVLALIVVGVAGYVFLPAAEIVVTPSQEPIELPLVVRADPDVKAPDATANVVPAQILDVPVEVSETFTTKGLRVVETKAKGEVTFTSENTFIQVTVPRGTRLATDSGISFVTTSRVVIPKASFSTGPSRKNAPIEAIRPGPSGKVEAGTITQRPTDLRLLLVSVTNNDATSGGTHEEFPQIQEAELTAAVESLKPKLTDAFTAAIESGAGAAPNVTVFGETAVLGDSTPSVDPATLVGKEQDSFELGLTATGTVIAVDAGPVSKIAETRLLSNVDADHRLVEGSINIVPGDPTVANGEVSFPVTARAAQVRILDPGELRTLVKGRSLEEARSLLAQFGEATVSAWPAWVSSVPSLDSRVSIEIVGQTAGRGEPSPGSSGATPPTGSGTPAPSPVPSAADGSTDASVSPGESSASSAAP